MVVDKIGNTGNIIPPGGSRFNKASKKEGVVNPDSVSISREAQKAQEEANWLNIVKKTSDVREERIDAVKQRVSEGYYDNKTEILEKVAEKIAQALLR